MSDHLGAQALFDAKAAGWPAKYGPAGRLAGRLARFTRAVTDRVDTGGAVLDLGCGSGELARCLAARGYRVTGCDIAPRMLSRAAAADHAHAVTWVKLAAGWRALPFEPGSVDAVVAASVLEYVPDPLAVLRECARVLRPGGILLCSVPDVTHPVRWLEWPLVLAARTPRRLLARGTWPRLDWYLTYLRASRQRRRLRWWQATGSRAGLRSAPWPARPAARAPLRLLAFTRPGDVPAGPLDSNGEQR
jgi:SAM-dependent methyltransferase